MPYIIYSLKCIWDFKVTQLYLVYDFWHKIALNFNVLPYSSNNSSETNLGVASHLYRTRSYGV